MQHRGIAFVERFVPTMVACVGSHLINIENHRRAEAHKIDIASLAETKEIADKDDNEMMVDLEELLDEESIDTKHMSLMDAAKELPKHKKAAWRKQRRNEVIDKTSVASGYERTKYPEFCTEKGKDVGRPLYMMHGDAADMRNHIIFVAPPGAGKTLLIRQFCDIEAAFLRYTPIRPVMNGSMTEAGLAGTITKKGDDYKFIPGEAAVHHMSIFGVEEMHAITGMMEGMHSLLEQFLMALDSGNVVKRLAGGKIRYKTHLTLMTGSQIGETRLKLDSGIARRFLFIFFSPTPEEWDIIYAAAFDAIDIRPNQIRTEIIRTKIEDIVFKLQEAEELRIDRDQFRVFGKKYGVPHYEINLMIRMAIGWTIMSQNFGKVINVQLTPEIEEMMLRQVKWRTAVKFGSSVAQIKAILDAMDGHMKRKDLIDHMVTYHSLSAKDVDKSLGEMRKFGMLVGLNPELVTLRGGGEKTVSENLSSNIEILRKANDERKSQANFKHKQRSNTPSQASYTSQSDFFDS